MALFWFEHLKGIVPNHLTGDAPESVVAPTRCRRCAAARCWSSGSPPCRCEAVVRGYVAGSGWKEYSASGTVCGVPLPAGLSAGQPLPQPIFTPATKAAVGDHDENISFEQLAELIGAARRRGARHRHPPVHRGQRLRADPRHRHRRHQVRVRPGRTRPLTLMDEALTPDSSRFWLADELQQGRIVALDKQPLRDWLAGTGVTGGAEQAALDLPDEVILGVHERYARAHRMLCGGDE
jgi:phosphoribosylaminoimidazole-succinocarboxamide synthase